MLFMVVVCLVVFRLFQDDEPRCGLDCADGVKVVSGFRSNTPTLLKQRIGKLIAMPPREEQAVYTISTTRGRK